MAVSYEKKFFDVLKNIFIGAKIEGESGYVNLMRVKSKYYDEFLTELNKDFDKAQSEFGEEFKKELFNKLYTFFHKYFSESGSIYFTNSAYRDKVYERIYRDDKDIMLFWKTQHLYYVKTDRLFKSIDVEIEGYKFFFDASRIELKKSNERRDLIFEFDKIKTVSGNKVVNFIVEYSQRGKKSKLDEIYRRLKKESGFKEITEEILETAFRVFNLQSEVDFFIHKDAGAFLKEQFSIWLKGYLLDDETEFNSKRIKQLKTLKEIANKIIDVVAQFENELVKIWNKPKFVLNSNYVITLDKISERDSRLIQKIIEHPNFDEQVKEWRDLGLIDNKFKKSTLKKESFFGDEVENKYRYLPIDTKYFKDIELEILNIFDNLDQELDGRLIHSENYQALRTIYDKFFNRVKCVYIDPPFNLDSSDQFMYRTNYKNSNWATLIENRVRIAKDLIHSTGNIFVRCDYNGNFIIRQILDDIFDATNFKNEIVINRISKKGFAIRTAYKAIKYPIANDFLFFYSKSENAFFNPVKTYRKAEKEKWHSMDVMDVNPKPRPRIILGKKMLAPPGRKWMYSQENIYEMEKAGLIRLNKNGVPQYKVRNQDYELLDTNWTDIPGYSFQTDFQTENSEILLERVINTTTVKNDLVLDFFMGSSTTQAVAHKLNRKWIGIEMGEHFYSVVVPRLKQVVFGKMEGISKNIKFRGGGFFKYFDMEQYEEVLNKSDYDDQKHITTKDIFNQYVFFKDKKYGHILTVDKKKKKIDIDLSKLYPTIDLAETLSNLKGKFIKRINKDFVEFDDGEKINLNDIDFRDIKPLIWW